LRVPRVVPKAGRNRRPVRKRKTSTQSAHSRPSPKNQQIALKALPVVAAGVVAGVGVA